MSRSSFKKDFGPQVHEVEYKGKKVYFLDLTVKVANFMVELRENRLKKAKEIFPDLDQRNQFQIESILNSITADEFEEEKLLAHRLCDKDGKRYYDPKNQEDLQEIADLDAGLIGAINNSAAALLQEQQEKKS